jgi:hypothetical protein
MSHVVAEVYYSGRWNLYDPTYNAFYLRLDDDFLHPLSFEELRSLHFNSPEKVSIISNTYRDKKSRSRAQIFSIIPIRLALLDQIVPSTIRSRYT